MRRVSQTYRQLEDEQWIVVRSQSGFYVTPRLSALARAMPTPDNAVVMRYIAGSRPSRTAPTASFAASACANIQAGHYREIKNAESAVRPRGVETTSHPDKTADGRDFKSSTTAVAEIALL